MTADPTNLSLAEQMHFDEFEIARRKDLLQFLQSDVDLLSSARPFVLSHLDEIVDEFYERQTSIADIALIIGDSETLRRLRSAQRSYIAELFAGYYDLEYANNRLRIGLVHKRIGVEPKYYLSAIATLKSILNSTINKNLPDTAVAAQTREALDKLLYFDNELVFDTYIRSMLSEIEVAKDKAISYAHNLEEKVAERTKALAKLSRVDALTGLLNKRAFLDEFRMVLARGKRARTPVSLLYIDLDEFKEINDTHGHLRGDEVLQRVGQMVRDVARETDLCGRHGGDEFCIVLPDTDQEQAAIVIQRLNRAAKDEAHISMSVGMANTGPDSFYDVERMIQSADSDMYEIKARSAERTGTSRSGQQQDNALEKQKGILKVAGIGA